MNLLSQLNLQEWVMMMMKLTEVVIEPWDNWTDSTLETQEEIPLQSTTSRIVNQIIAYNQSGQRNTHIILSLISRIEKWRDWEKIAMRDEFQ